MPRPEQPNDYGYPLKGFVKAVKDHGAIDPNDSSLRSALARIARPLQGSHDKEMLKLAHQLETLLGPSSDAITAEVGANPTPSARPGTLRSRPRPVRRLSWSP